MQTPKPSVDVFLIDVEACLPLNLRMRVICHYSYDTLHLAWEKCMHAVIIFKCMSRWANEWHWWKRRRQRRSRPGIWEWGDGMGWFFYTDMCGDMIEKNCLQGWNAVGDKLCGCNGCNAVAFRMNVLGSRQSKKILEQIKEIIKHYIWRIHFSAWIKLLMLQRKLSLFNTIWNGTIRKW